jgi:hypothetical protein
MKRLKNVLDRGSGKRDELNMLATEIAIKIAIGV